MTVAATDTIARRRELSRRMGAAEVWDPRAADVVREVKALTGGRGADAVIVATSAAGITEQAIACSRPGARILGFAQTSHQERIEVSGADICVGERALLGCYSASVDLQAESARLVFSGYGVILLRIRGEPQTVLPDDFIDIAPGAPTGAVSDRRGG